MNFNMKKIFLMAYARKNLGDDLFIKMLLERYPMNEFYMKINKKEFLSDLEKNHSNLNIIKGNDTDEELYKTDVNEYDAYIYIGGSIFMEGGKVYNLSEKFYDFVVRCKKNNKPFCYISCNYGPYQTQEYFELSRKNFYECTDICFRDKYSYDLFKDINTVRYAPDYAFSYKIEAKSKIPNSIGISVIDLGIRNDLKPKQEKYIEFLANNIREYIKKGKKVYLYSFCKHEGDEKTIDNILSKFDDKSNLIDVRYDGKIDEFMDLYGRMEYMICSRFHAMILSCIARQKVYVMSYSKKIDNVIDDLKLDLPVINFSDINENIKLNLEDFAPIEEKKISDIISESANQEKKIQKI